MTELPADSLERYKQTVERCAFLQGDRFRADAFLQKQYTSMADSVHLPYAANLDDAEQAPFRSDGRKRMLEAMLARSQLKSVLEMPMALSLHHCKCEVNQHQPKLE